MALSKPRKLVLGGKMYHWKVSTNGRPHYAIFDTETKKKMAVWFDSGQVITPAVVRKSIEESKEREWK